RSQSARKRLQFFARMNLSWTVGGIVFQRAWFLVGLLLRNQVIQHFILSTFPCHSFASSSKTFGFWRWRFGPLARESFRLRCLVKCGSFPRCPAASYKFGLPAFRKGKVLQAHTFGQYHRLVVGFVHAHSLPNVGGCIGPLAWLLTNRGHVSH